MSMLLSSRRIKSPDFEIEVCIRGVPAYGLVGAHPVPHQVTITQFATIDECGRGGNWEKEAITTTKFGRLWLVIEDESDPIGVIRVFFTTDDGADKSEAQMLSVPVPFLAEKLMVAPTNTFVNLMRAKMAYARLSEFAEIIETTCVDEDFEGGMTDMLLVKGK